MKDNLTIKSLRGRRNGFIGNSLKRSKINEEQKNASGNQFIASLIMNTKMKFFPNEVIINIP